MENKPSISDTSPEMKRASSGALVVLIRIITGIAFILSGALKLVPAEYLENDILRSGLANDTTVPFIARFVIGSEFFLGSMLVFGLLRRLTLKLCIASLIVYTTYLVYVIALFGNEGNCGCFGRQFELTPLEGIWKNLVMGIGCVFVLRKSGIETRTTARLIFAGSLALLSLVLPFVIYKVDLPEKINVGGTERTLIDLDPLYRDQSVAPPFDARSGKVLLMFASLSCEHCRVAASKLELIKTKHPEWNIYIVYNGKEELISDFHKDAQIRNTPCHLFNDGEAIARMVGVGFPIILLLEDATVVSTLNYPELQEDNLRTFFSGN